MINQIDTQHWELSLLGCAVKNYTLEAQEALNEDITVERNPLMNDFFDEY